MRRRMRISVRPLGAIGWARANLFSSWSSTLVTLVLLYLLARGAYALMNWSVVNATWFANAQGAACDAAKSDGACWAVIAEKHRFILFGTYPFEEHWRPATCVAIFVALYLVSAVGRFSYRLLTAIWLVGLTTIGTLMWGGIFGLGSVPQERWGGLVVTLILATFGLAFAFPLAILVALGRTSKLPAIKTLCVVFVELIRGVPLISLLFMASVVLPLFLPDGVSIDQLLRAQIAFMLFATAYVAEVIRAGLLAIPEGQYEAADALGLSYWKKTALIILPQALRIVIPPLVNTFIGFFKDTSLVLIIGIFDLLNAGKAALLEPRWQGYGLEVYTFVGLIYFIFCFAMSRYSQKLEAQLGRQAR
jgi:general L-amino acid transport system permease protein